MTPAIVLVAPQLGENIGMVARAMWNFGFSDLRLVSPRNGWPNPDAGPAAVGADHILDQAQLFDDIPTSVADCHRVYTTAMVLRRMLKETVTPAGAVKQALDLAPQGGRCAWVFGPERTGLFTNEVAMGDVVITIPTNPQFGSLNLAMAVTVMGYEWVRQTGSMPDVELKGDLSGPAPRGELEALLAHLDEELTQRDYFFPPHRAATMRRTLRGLFQRQALTVPEVRTLRGVIRSLAEKPRGHSKG